MAANKMTGEVPVTIAGTDYTLHYDWRAIGALVTEFGEDAGTVLSDVVMNPFAKIEAFAKTLEIGLQRHHPDMTLDRIMELSPPVAEVIKPVAVALGYAFTGGKNEEEVPESAENPPRAA